MSFKHTAVKIIYLAIYESNGMLVSRKNKQAYKYTDISIPIHIQYLTKIYCYTIYDMTTTSQQQSIMYNSKILRY